MSQERVPFALRKVPVCPGHHPAQHIYVYWISFSRGFSGRCKFCGGKGSFCCMQKGPENRQNEIIALPSVPPPEALIFVVRKHRFNPFFVHRPKGHPRGSITLGATWHCRANPRSELSDPEARLTPCGRSTSLVALCLGCRKRSVPKKPLLPPPPGPGAGGGGEMHEIAGSSEHSIFLHLNLFNSVSLSGSGIGSKY